MLQFYSFDAPVTLNYIKRQSLVAAQIIQKTKDPLKQSGKQQMLRFFLSKETFQSSFSLTNSEVKLQFMHHVHDLVYLFNSHTVWTWWDVYHEIQLQAVFGIAATLK